MAIALDGTPTTAEAAGSSALTQNVPTVASGSLLVWVTSQTTATPIAVNSGWTERQQGITGATTLQVWYRFASSEPASYTTAARTASRCFGVMLGFSGVDANSPWDVVESAMGAGTTAVTCPSVTPVTDGAWVLSSATGLVGAGVINTTVSSSNTTIDVQTTSTNGASTNMAGGVSHFAWTSGAFTPAWTHSNATTRTLGAALALRPALGASDPSPQWTPGFMTGTTYPGFMVARAQVGWVPAELPYDSGSGGPQANQSSLTATLSFTGAQTRRTAHGLTAAASFGGTGSASYNTTINAVPSLIARWKLDDTSGAVAVASVGSDGGYTFSPTLGDPGLVSDGGTAVTYDGNGTQESTHPFGALSTAGWVAFWFKSTDASAVGIPLRDTTSTNGTFPINFGGTNVAARVGGTDHTISPAVASSTLKDGNRHFIVFQTDGSNVSLYIDGTLAETWTRAAHTWNNILVSPWHLAHNGSSAGAANYLAMTGDDLAMGDNATLTAGDVTNLWNAGTGTGSASLTKRTSTARTATVAFAGAIASRAGKALAATLAFVGALTTPVGNLFTQALTATVSFTGAQAKRTATVKTATVSFAGTQTRAVAKLVTAAVSFTAAQARRVAAGLAATLSFAGALTRRVGHPFTATVSFTGSLATAAVHVFTQALTATLSFTGAQARRTGAVKTATVAFTGAQARRTAVVKTAALSFTGAQVNRVSHLFTATVSFTGAQTRRAGHLLAATVSFTGSHATLAVHFFTQALTATVGFTGAFAKRTTRVVAATVGFTVGALTRRISSGQTATVGFAGTLGRGIGHKLSAAVGFGGTLLGLKSGTPTGPFTELIIPARLGTLEIPDVARTLAIPADTRTLEIPTADRNLTIPAVATLTIQIPEVMMADYRVVQKQTASLTYIGNCANRLSKAYPASPVTITSAALGSITGGPVITSVSGTGTTFTFHAVTSAATPATTPEPLLTINLTLSNGDVDPIEITIGVVT